MGDQPTLLVGRVSDVGPDYVVLGKTRIELHADQHPSVFVEGYSAAVMARMVAGKLVDGRIVEQLVTQPTV